MAVIENFAELSAEEQSKFAASLLNTINSERLFSAETDFKVGHVEADDLTGELVIEVSLVGHIEVSREATWTCTDSAEAYQDPGYETEYSNSIFEDTKKVFKTLFNTSTLIPFLLGMQIFFAFLIYS